MYWDGGYGQAGEVLESSATSATRAFANLSSTSPPICTSGDLASCRPVDLEGWAFPSDPSDVGLGFSEVNFDSPLGELGAWVVPADGSSTWVIHVHGWSAARRETVRMLPAYHRQGITSMVIDYRNDPGAPVDPSGHYRFGLTEWEDVDAAVEHALARGANRILLSGYSTGAAAVMAFTERSKRTGHVVAIVFDSPNIDVGLVVLKAASEMQLPVVPWNVPRSLAKVAMTIADLRWDVDWEAIDYGSRADRLSIPVLVFHGRADRRVPIDVSRALAAKNPAHIRLIEVPEAAHVMSWNANPAAYEAELEEFLASLPR